MVDSDRRQLERDLQAGDASALAKLQNLNDRTGPTTDDILYFEGYLDICEQVLGRKSGSNPPLDISGDVLAWIKSETSRQISLAEGMEKLAKLNKQFETKVGSKTLKKELIIRDGLFYPNSRVYEGTRNCKRAIELATQRGQDVNNLDERIDECDDYKCKTCSTLTDGWVPSSICW